MTAGRTRHDDGGQVLVLTLFLAVVLLLLVTVVVDASAAFLARRALAGDADGAALAAAQSVDLTAYYRGGRQDTLPLGDVAATVEDYAATVGADADDVRLTDGGTTVTVTLHRHLALPLAFPGYGAGLDVTATATARLPLRP
jgi:Flp pilus assembly protein TadG